jgi:hypothetical protein
MALLLALDTLLSLSPTASGSTQASPFGQCARRSIDPPLRE